MCQRTVRGRPAKSPGFEWAAEFEVGDQVPRYELRVEETGDGVRVTHENGYLARLTPEEFAASERSSSIVRTPDRGPLQVFDRSGRGDFTWFRSENEEGDEINLAHDCNESSSMFLSMLHEFSLRGELEMDFTISMRIMDTLKRGSVQCSNWTAGNSDRRPGRMATMAAGSRTTTAICPACWRS